MIMAFYRNLFFLLLTLLPAGVTGWAQISHSKSFEIDESRPSLATRMIFKDHNGILWVATNAGLYRFNGVKCQYIPMPGDSLREVSAIGEGSDNTLWVGFQTGAIATVRNNQASWFRPEEGLPRVAITSFYTDPFNRTWFATAGEGVYYTAGRHLYNIDSPDGLTDNYVYTLMGDSAGWVLAGTDRGISFIQVTGNRKEIKTFSAKDGLPDNIVRSITPSDMSGYWWIGMQDKGICLLDVRNRQLVNNHISTSWSNGQVNDVLDLGKELWIATEEGGVWLYDKEHHRLQPQLFKNLPAATKINDLQPDNEGNIWLTNNNNVVRTTGNGLLFYPALGSHPLTSINAVAAGAGYIWVANGAQLISYNPNTAGGNTRVVYDLTRQQTAITCLYPDAQGYLWIGTMGNGLKRMQTATGAQRSVEENPLLQGGHILSITGNKNSVWVASLNGITELKLTETNRALSAPFSYHNYGKQDGIGSDYVYHLAMDSKERLWLATDGAGVALRENGRFRNLLSEAQLKTTVVYSVTEDKQGTIWVNTLNEGVYRFDGKAFSSVTVANGLSDITITSVLADKRDGLIVINKMGIDIFGITDKKVFHLGKESGIGSAQAALNAICMDERGFVWLALKNELVRYQPFLKPLPAPKVLIDRVEIFGRAIDTSAAHRYDYQQNNIRFLLSGIYYTDPEKLKYQYQLIGYNNKWETTSDNSIIFPQLPDGSYVLNVRVSANGNFENMPRTSFAFTIQKPFWRQWWFIGPVVVLALFVFYLLLQQRVRKIKKQEQVKQERFRFQYDALKSQVNPHFLFNSFNALLGVIEERPSEAAEFVKQLSAFYRKMTAHRDKDIISLKEELEMLQTYLFIQKKRYGAALQATIDVAGDVQEKKALPPLSLQLLAENAVKHNAISAESPLHLLVNVQQGFLVVSNNTNPKINKETGEGVGLQNIENRFRILTNQAMYYENTGNAFTVKLPLLNLE
jgi:ligand-binding sensor domain-containing protein/two-component sensor histidine kinase